MQHTDSTLGGYWFASRVSAWAYLTTAVGIVVVLVVGCMIVDPVALRQDGMFARVLWSFSPIVPAIGVFVVNSALMRRAGSRAGREVRWMALLTERNACWQAARARLRSA